MADLKPDASQPEEATIDEICAVAIAEAFRGDGEILCNPIGTTPIIGGRLARATFEPAMVMTDAVSVLAANPLPVGDDNAERLVEAWMPYRDMFDVVWSGRRHIVMGASQIDAHGNQNLAAIGDWRRPKAQLLGLRGAPGNLVNHATTYWVPNHSTRSFVPSVDCGVGSGLRPGSTPVGSHPGRPRDPPGGVQPGRDGLRIQWIGRWAPPDAAAIGASRRDGR